MGLLSGCLEQRLEPLLHYYTYVSGTRHRLKLQTADVLAKRYELVQELDPVVVRSLSTGMISSDIINAAFKTLTIDEALPTQIVPALNRLGIHCNAVNIAVQRYRSTGAIILIKFQMFAKKSGGRERYVYMGLAEVQIQSDWKKPNFQKHQDFWNKMIDVWKKNESVRLSAIFRRKKQYAQMDSNQFGIPATYVKYEHYVNS